MANLRVDITEPLLDGMDIKFKAPCNCTAVTGLVVYYPLEDESGIGSQTFTFKDALGNNLAGLGNLFAEGAVVKVLVDRAASAAYIQNAATNKYLENKIATAKTTLSTSVSSNSTTTAATSSAVKNAYDRASSALTAANNAMNMVNNLGSSSTLTPTNYGVGDGGTFHEATVRVEQVGRIVLCEGVFAFTSEGYRKPYLRFGSNFPEPASGLDPLPLAVWDGHGSMCYGYADVVSTASDTAALSFEFYHVAEGSVTAFEGTHRLTFTLSYIAAE